MKEKRKNDFKKKLLKQNYKILTIGLAFFTSICLWLYILQLINGKISIDYIPMLCVGIVFVAIYCFFAKIYQAHKIGMYRLTELVYFQILSYGIADFILLLEAVIWYHKFSLRMLAACCVSLIIQIAFVVIIVFVSNRIFVKIDVPREILIIYGKEDYKVFLNKFYEKNKRYHVYGCYQDSVSMDLLMDKISKCENVYLYEVKKDVRKELVIYCHSIGKDIYITQDIDNLITMGFDISHTFDTPLIHTKKELVKWYYPIFKRVMDIVCSGIGLCVSLPILVITAASIKLYDGGPVFYTQVRLTKNHKKFTIYKFRSMVANAEKQGIRLASQNDDRITPVGKIIRRFRIDELPQLINILKGDMSLVGPRPERPEIEELYLKELPEFGLRLGVKAGLTGYAQVFGKYNTTPLDKLKLDLLYINQQSIFLDFKIILYTIKIIFIPESTQGIENGKITAGNR